jgi:hypothetical protein
MLLCSGGDWESSVRITYFTAVKIKKLFLELHICKQCVQKWQMFVEWMALALRGMFLCANNTSNTFPIAFLNHLRMTQWKDHFHRQEYQFWHVTSRQSVICARSAPTTTNNMAMSFTLYPLDRTIFLAACAFSPWNTLSTCRINCTQSELMVVFLWELYRE